MAPKCFSTPSTLSASLRFGFCVIALVPFGEDAVAVGPIQDRPERDVGTLMAEEALKLITQLERQYADQMAPDQATAAAMAWRRTFRIRNTTV